MRKTILVTGGAGYIGSHTCIALLDAGYDVIVVDNLCNSKKVSLERVAEISGRSATFYPVDIRDGEALANVFAKHPVKAVIHFAGLKAVGESVEKPLEYYHNNVYGTLVLCKVMAEAGVKEIVFSSSATVYGMSTKLPFKEDTPTSATNPYGRSKLFIEKILEDLTVSDPAWNVTLLRYFNPVGAHPSGLIGEDPNGTPNNLLPYITQVAVGRLKKLRVYGNDYPTHDGTGIRDYIHVLDLAEGHVKALKGPKPKDGAAVYNLGTGRGYSVLDVIKAFKKENHVPIPYEIAPRRAGDIASSFADPEKAEKILKWKASRSLEDMVRDAWNWQQRNPQGYA